MNYIPPLLFALLFTVFQAEAQNANRIQVNSLDDMDDLITATSNYRFPHFSIGIVYLKSGSPVTAPMNYNMLLGEMQFIDTKGDTLSIADPETIDYLLLDDKVFYYDKGILELISEFNSVKLVKRVKFQLADKQKTGGYGQPTTAGAVTSFSSISSNGKQYNLSVSETIVFKKYTTYLLLPNNNSTAYVANKNGLYKTFQKRKSDIDQHIRQYNLNLKKQQDLVSLLLYLDSRSN
jgi:hypothetical protein